MKPQIITTILLGAINLFPHYTIASNCEANPTILKQREGQNNSIKINGKVIITEDKTTLPYALVSIVGIRSDGSRTSAFKQVCDNNGNFIISVPQTEKYEISVSYTGMKKKVMVVEASAINNLTIKMDSDTQELSNIVVTKTRKLVSVDLDKINYDVAADPDSKTLTALDFLRRIPLVTISGNDQIQIAGSSSFQVYLNGKPTNILGSQPGQALKGIPASAFKKIEVITDPGVKYSADNKGKILNLVTATNNQKMKGYTGSITSSYSTNGYANLGINISGGKNKWGYNFNINGNGFFNMPNYNEIEKFDKTGKSITNEIYDTKFNRASPQLSGSISYEADSSNLFNATFTLSPDLLNIKQQAFDRIIDKTINKSTTDITTMGGSMQIGYQHNFANPQQMLTLSYQFLGGKDRDKVNYDLPSLFPTTEKYNRNLEHTFQTDLTLPFGKNHLLETGLKYINRRNKSENLRPIQSDYFEGTDIMALYGLYTFKANQWSFRIGARMEESRVQSQYRQQDFQKWMKPDFVPQLTIGYQISPASLLKLDYTMNISRPSILQLSPFELRFANVIKVGNKDLKTEKSHNLTISYNNFTPKNQLQASLFYSYSKDAIQTAFLSDENDPKILRQTFINIGMGMHFGSSLYYSYTGLKWMRPMVNAFFGLDRYQNKKMGNIPEIKGKNIYSYQLYMGSQFFLPKSWQISAGGYTYHADTGYGNQMEGFNYGGNVSIQKSLLKDRLTLSLSVNSILRKYTDFKIRSWSEMPNQYRIVNKNLTRNITFGITYTFGNMKVQRAKKISKNIINNDINETKGQF